MIRPPSKAIDPRRARTGPVGQSRQTDAAANQLRVDGVKTPKRPPKEKTSEYERGGTRAPEALKLFCRMKTILKCHYVNYYYNH